MNSRRRALVAAAVLTCTFGILVPELIAAQLPDYSNAAQYLSELGASGAPYAFWANYFGFLPVALSVAAVCLLIPVVLKPSTSLVVASILLLGVSVGYLGAVVVPCDPGCAPTAHPTRQALHNLLALPEYGGSILALFVFAVTFKSRALDALAVLTLLAATAVLVGFVLMVISADATRGAWQRVADYSIFVWMLIASVMLGRDDMRAIDLG
jgi:hypothetical membrane protein